MHAVCLYVQLKKIAIRMSFKCLSYKKKNVSKKTIHVATSKDKRIYLKIKHIEG